MISITVSPLAQGYVNTIKPLAEVEFLSLLSVVYNMPIVHTFPRASIGNA